MELLLLVVLLILKLKLLETKDWPLPKSMYSKSSLLEKLKEEGLIDFKKKFGLILYTSDIYIAY